MKRALMWALMFTVAGGSSVLVHASQSGTTEGLRCDGSVGVTLLLPPHLANLQNIRMTFTTTNNEKNCSEAVQVEGEGPVRRISLQKAASVASGSDGRLTTAVMERDHVRCNVAQPAYDKGPSVVCQ